MKISVSFTSFMCFIYLFLNAFSIRAKQLISRVGDQGPAFFKRDIQKLNEEITNNFQNETTEIKESLMKHFVEA